jgi:hypothetical protein
MLSGLSSNKLEDQNKNPRSLSGKWYKTHEIIPIQLISASSFLRKKLYFSRAERFIGHFSGDKYSFECVQPWIERTIGLIEIEVLGEVCSGKIIILLSIEFSTQYNSATFGKHSWISEYAEKKFSSKSVNLKIIFIMTH